MARLIALNVYGIGVAVLTVGFQAQHTAVFWIGFGLVVAGASLVLAEGE